MRVLVIPAGQTASDLGPRGRTWAQHRDDNQCDSIENLGSPWCVANGIDGIGVCGEKVSLVPTTARIIAEAERRQREAPVLRFRRATR